MKNNSPHFFRKSKMKKDVQAVIFDESQKIFFFIIRREDVAVREYHWRLVKGGIEKDEKPEEALKREIFEEVGLKNIKVLNRIYGYEFTFSGIKHLVSTYLVKGDLTERPKTPSVNGNVVISGFAWLNFNSAIRLLRWEDERKALEKAYEYLISAKNTV